MAQKPFEQIRDPLGTFTNSRPHPSRGGNPYPDEMRHEVMTRYHLGIPLVSPELDLLRAQVPPAFPAYISCERYINQFHEMGHTRPKKATGNHKAEREVRGEAWPRLALFRMVHPQATIDEVRAFLFNMDPGIAPLSPRAIVKAKHILNLRRKRSSTTCERRLTYTNVIYFGRQTTLWVVPTSERVI
jgi:hypothetical protein